MSYLPPSFAHLRRLTDEGGLYEHAQGIVPRREHGYCLDDVARALVVVSRETEPDSIQDDLAAQYLFFVLAAQSGDGRFRNRRGTDLSWQGQPSVEDCWGRGLWGLGAAVSGQGEPHLRDSALTAFERGAGWRSPHSRAMAFAALGAAEVLSVVPEHRGALELIAAAAQMIGGLEAGGGWLWPEPRLTYANAVLPEALLVAGTALDAPPSRSRWAAALGLAARRADPGRTPVRRPGRGSGAGRHRPRIRPAADRGRRAGRRLRPGTRSHG